MTSIENIDPRNLDRIPGIQKRAWPSYCNQSPTKEHKWDDSGTDENGFQVNRCAYCGGTAVPWGWGDRPFLPFKQRGEHEMH